MCSTDDEEDNQDEMPTAHPPQFVEDQDHTVRTHKYVSCLLGCL